MDDVAVTIAVCELLGTAGVGAWRPDGPAYTPDEVAIVYGALPTSPDRAIAVRVYNTDDDVQTGTATRWAQVRTRGAHGDPADADRLASAAFTALHARHHVAGFARLTRTSAMPLGADENGRQERTDNYQLILTPTPLEAAP